MHVGVTAREFQIMYCMPIVVMYTRDSTRAINHHIHHAETDHARFSNFLLGLL